MLKALINAPMLISLALKERAMRKVLAMAEEQSRDAAELGCIRCLLSETGCTSDPDCRLHRFKDNEALVKAEIAEIRQRMQALRK